MRFKFISFFLLQCFPLVFISCQQRLGDKQVKLTIALTDSNSSITMESVLPVIKERLDTYGVFQEDMIVEQMSSDEATLVVKGIDNVSELIEIISIQGKLEFWSGIEIRNLFPFIQKADSVLGLDVVIENNQEDIVGLFESDPDKTLSAAQNEDESYSEINEFKTPLVYALSNSEFLANPIAATFKSDHEQLQFFDNIEKTKEWFPEDMVHMKGRSYDLPAVYFLKLEADNEPLLSTPDIQYAYADFDQTGRPIISLQFEKRDAAVWERITTSLIGKSIPMSLDGSVIMAPTVQSSIPNGRCVISGDLTYEECKYVSILVKKPLPAKIKVKKVW